MLELSEISLMPLRSSVLAAGLSLEEQGCQPRPYRCLPTTAPLVSWYRRLSSLRAVCGVPLRGRCWSQPAVVQESSKGSHFGTAVYKAVRWFTSVISKFQSRVQPELVLFSEIPGTMCVPLGYHSGCDPAGTCWGCHRMTDFFPFFFPALTSQWDFQCRSLP